MKGVEHSNNQAARIRPWLMIVLLLSPGWLYGQGQPPLVSTSFSIQTPVFNTISQQTRTNLEKNVAEYLAELCRTHFGFLRWASFSDTLSSSAFLVLRLTGQPGPFGSTISLEYTAKVLSQDLDLSQVPKDRLYNAWDDQPTHDPQRLLREVRAKIDEQFRSDNFRQALHSQFLKAIPLTQKIHVDDKDHRLIIPIQ